MTAPEVRRLAYSVISCYPQARSGWCVHVAAIVVDPKTGLYLSERGNEQRMDKTLSGFQVKYIRDQLVVLETTPVVDPIDWLLDLHAASGALMRASLPQAISAPSLVAAMQILVGQLFDVTEGAR